MEDSIERQGILRTMSMISELRSIASYEQAEQFMDAAYAKGYNEAAWYQVLLAGGLPSELAILFQNIQGES